MRKRHSQTQTRPDIAHVWVCSYVTHSREWVRVRSEIMKSFLYWIHTIPIIYCLEHVTSRFAFETSVVWSIILLACVLGTPCVITPTIFISADCSRVCILSASDVCHRTIVLLVWSVWVFYLHMFVLRSVIACALYVSSFQPNLGFHFSIWYMGKLYFCCLCTGNMKTELLYLYVQCIHSKWKTCWTIMASLIIIYDFKHSLVHWTVDIGREM